MSTATTPSPRQCKHPNIELIEHGTASTWHRRKPNGKWESNSDFGDYTGALTVKCRRCGYRRHFTPGQQRPKWVEAVVLEMETAPEDTDRLPPHIYSSPEEQGEPEERQGRQRAVRGRTAPRKRQRGTSEAREAMLLLVMQAAIIARTDPEMMSVPPTIRQALRRVAANADDVLALAEDHADER